MDVDERLNALGLVLAGGRSRRMGADKASLRFGDETLLTRAVTRLRALPLEVIVLGPAGLAELVPEARVIPDAEPGAGPLAALATAFALYPGRALVVVGCDMPFLNPQFVRELLRRAARGGADVVIPHTTDGMQYLHAVYLPGCASMATRLLKQGERSLHRLVQEVRAEVVAPDEVRHLDPTGRSAVNVNTPEQWQHALDVLRAGSEL